jgi:hypothetical protein
VTSLPKFLVSATASLFEQGLADPRGCDYRSIQVVVGDVWGGKGQLVTTSGWVLPNRDGTKPWYAVAWNGLVYPLSGGGRPADLGAHIRARGESVHATPKIATPTIPAKNQRQPRRGFADLSSNSEANAIAIESLHPIKMCLLLRLGRADLAEMIWEMGTGRAAQPVRPGGKPKFDLNSYGISYLSLASDLAWYRFDRAIGAHMRGDDVLALADVRALDAMAAAVETRAEQMGFARPERAVPPGQLAPYIEFLDQLPELREDQERRARERANPLPPIPVEGRQARTAKLIHDLDQVAARQWSQPGGVFLGESPIVKELIACGDDAVEPLIKTLRVDDRLTRSVGFGRSFFRHRTILHVNQAAFVALQGILKTTHFAPPEQNEVGRQMKNRETLANQIQAYWERNRTVPVTERWFLTLADDEAGSAAWLEAAGNIVQPENVRTVPGGGAFVLTETTPLKPGERPRIRGESLRGKHDPSVADLLSRRVESMLKTPEGQQFELLNPCRLAGMLGEWDAAGSVPTLRELSRICRERYARGESNRDWTNQNLAVSIARFALARAQGGDTSAFREYGEWISTVRPEWLGPNLLTVLEPLYRQPDDPALAAAAARLFRNPHSPWLPLIGRKGATPKVDLGQLIASPMVKVPAFRSMLLEGLRDRARFGTATLGENGMVRVETESGFSMSRTAPADDRDKPGKDLPVPIRVCDVYAWMLTTLEGAPAFNPCLSEAKRDSSLAAVASFMKSKGPRP